jgi:hypothetical protein
MKYLLVLLLIGCGSPARQPAATDIECARNFIDAIFKGNFKAAGYLLLPGNENENLLNEKLKKDYNNRTGKDRERLGTASIVINNIEKVVNDSVTIVYFINSYDNQPAKLKVVKINNEWLADLKYTYSGNL